MRSHGRLTKWNEERGFGFISHGSGEIFVHISAYPRDGKRPELNELISFETEVGPGGKIRAVKVMRAGPSKQVSGVTIKKHSGLRSGGRGFGLAILLAAMIAMLLYSGFQDRVGLAQQLQPFAVLPRPENSGDSFECDGRTLCSQMRSCAEAKYFLANCPNTKLDGNRDGEPCEQQWCN